MALLHNRVSNRELKQRLLDDPTPRTTISFYKYHPIQNPAGFRDELWKGLQPLGVLGRIYVAREGINAQISVPTERLEELRSFLYSYHWMDGLRLNIAVDDDGKSFWVLKIKVRDKIVADGYEYEVGHFENAIEIPSDTFREQLPMAADMMKGREDKPIIMYCTGGIRCEKASAYMLHRGFQQVYHIEGGIINYVHQVQEEGLEQKFLGKNFVFDNRMGERVTDDIIARCHQCGKPADTHTNCV
ncbi:MAG: rhodanese-like domain-containing protein, partial [Chitinophagaceae bacterium]|nr:rhodanese-like domain-containing protein [Chitinophagaceae bacterium]